MWFFKDASFSRTFRDCFLRCNMKPLQTDGRSQIADTTLHAVNSPSIGTSNAYMQFPFQKYGKNPNNLLISLGHGFSPFSQIYFWLEAKSYTGSQWFSAHMNPGFSCLSVPIQALDHNSVLHCLRKEFSLWEREENSQQNSLWLLTFDKNEETTLLIFKRLSLPLRFS